MEIPYEVTARPDTGLWNAKIGIWLFLASEVMLFGGLFSSYVFLRIGADYPWPVHELDVWPGFVNTFVLIASSVTVVFSWAFLKMRQYQRFRMAMGATVLCALIFLGLKAYEYYHKFTHWAVRLPDGSVLDGHRPEAAIKFGDVHTVDIDFRKGTTEFLKFSTHPDSKFKLPDGTVVEKLTGSVLRGEKKKADGQRAVAQNKIDDLNARLGRARAADKPAIQKDLEATKLERGKIPTSLHLTVEGPPLEFEVPRTKATNTYGPSELNFRTGVKLTGRLINDDLKIEVSGYDLRQVKGLDKNFDAADNALIWKYLGEEHRQAFLHQKQEALAEFKHKYGDRAPSGEAMRAAFKGEHLGGHDHHEHMDVTVPAHEVRFFSNYSPHLNTYYGIYFLMTGLHGLHVIGGAIVLSYFLFCCRWLYDKNPEHLTNRVEVGGLFWHFVDLVWIFLFPVFYLL